MQQFIRENAHKPVAETALKLAKNKTWPRELIVRQIEGLQKAKDKLLLLYATEGIIFPPRLNMEQCSSQATATYKAALLKGKHVVDITGGLGIDSLFFAMQCPSVVYVERNEDLFPIARHNFNSLKINNIQCFNGDGIEFLQDFSAPAPPQETAIYIDPARRDGHNQKVFLLSHCEPDVVQHLPLLFQFANRVLIKTSPMLDIHLAVQSLVGVAEVHVVSVENECKEVLYLLQKGFTEAPRITTVNLVNETTQQAYSFCTAEENRAQATCGPPQKYLYEPNASVLKAGAFKKIAEDFGLTKLAPHTHLYTSGTLVATFPGRIFSIEAALPYKDPGLYTYLSERKANVATRNFPYTPEEVKKTLKLKDGGSWFLFGVKDASDKLLVLVGKRV